MNAPIDVKNLLPTSGLQQGHEIVHESAHLHVTGEAAYTDDMPELAGTLYAVWLRWNRPADYARIATTNVDAEVLEDPSRT